MFHCHSRPVWFKLNVVKDLHQQHIHSLCTYSLNCCPILPSVVHMVCRRTPALLTGWASSPGCDGRLRPGRVRIVSETGRRAPGHEGRSRAPACQEEETEGLGQADVDLLSREGNGRWTSQEWRAACRWACWASGVRRGRVYEGAGPMVFSSSRSLFHLCTGLV